jgi:hypothetical protein
MLQGDPPLIRRREITKMHDDPHDDWEKLFDQVPVDSTVSLEQRESARLRVLEAFESPPTPRSRHVTLQAIGHTLMKYKIPHGIVAMLFLAGMFWLLQSVSTPALALDVLIEKFMKAKTARYDTIVTVEGQPPLKMKGFYLEPTHMREENDGYVNISDWAARKRIGLDSKTKRATVFNLKNLPDEMKNGMQEGNWFEGMRQMLRAATTDPKAKVISLGEKQLDGRKVVGFRFESPGTPMTLWADPVTQLPVRIESTVAGPPKTEVVMTNFEFNIELDKSLFSVEIPDGYTVTDVKVDLSPPSESDLITALRMCCEVSKGEFPTGFDAFSVGKYAATYLHKKGIDVENGATGEQLQETIKIARGFQFVLLLPKEADAHYARAGAKHGDSERAILWFKPIGSEKYRVIYADLSVRESNEAPKVADAIRLSK